MGVSKQKQTGQAAPKGKTKSKPKSMDAAVAMIPRETDGKFKKGYNPFALGLAPQSAPRKRASGRRALIGVLDRLAAEEDHVASFEIEVRAYIAKYGMMRFYESWLFPLIPKEMVLKTIGGGMSDGPPAIAFNFGPRISAGEEPEQEYDIVEAEE